MERCPHHLAQVDQGPQTELFVLAREAWKIVNHHCKVSDLAEQFDVSPRTTVRYHNKLNYYVRAARRKPFL